MRCSGERNPRTQAPISRAKSARKYRKVATMAPNWMIAVKAVTAGSSTGCPSSFSAMVRWPVLDTGRNSVSPSTIPRMTAST